MKGFANSNERETIVYRKHIASFYDAVLALFAVSLQGNNENIDLLIKKGLNEPIAEIFKNSDTTQDRYIYLLQVMNEVSKQSEEVASYFQQEKVFVKLRERIG